MCLLGRIGTPERFNLTLSVHCDDFAQVAEWFMGWLPTTSGAEVKYGRAPRTGLERNISKKLDPVQVTARSARARGGGDRARVVASDRRGVGGRGRCLRQAPMHPAKAPRPP